MLAHLGTSPHLTSMVVDEVASTVTPAGPDPGRSSLVLANATGLGSEDPRSLYAWSRTSYRVNSSNPSSTKEFLKNYVEI